MVLLLSIFDDWASSPQLAAREQQSISALNWAAACVLKVFLTRADGAVGWLTIITGHANIDAAKVASPLLRRLIAHLTHAHGLIKLPSLIPDEVVKDENDRNRMLMPTQLGKSTYKSLFVSMGIVQPLAPWDFCIVEADAGVGDLLDLAGDSYMSEPLGQRPDSQCPLWAGLMAIDPDCRSNARRQKACDERAESLKQRLAQKRRDARRLQRNDSTTKPQLDNLAKKLPAFVGTPDGMLDGYLEDPETLIDTGRAVLHLGATERPAVGERPPALHDDTDIPDELALAMACQELGVVAAPSQWVRRRQGLFPTRSFRAGEIIFDATTATGWTKPSGCPMHAAREMLPHGPLAILTVEAVDTICRQPSVWALAGQPGRDPWAAMIVVQAQEKVVATVVAKASPGSSFPHFVAAQDITPFSCELVWDIDATQGTIAPTVKAILPGIVPTPRRRPPRRTAQAQTPRGNGETEAPEAIGGKRKEEQDKDHEGGGQGATPRTKRAKKKASKKTKEEEPDEDNPEGSGSGEDMFDDGNGEEDQEEEEEPDQEEEEEEEEDQSRTAGTAAKKNGSGPKRARTSTGAGTARAGAESGGVARQPAGTWLATLEKPKADLHLHEGAVTLTYHKATKQVKKKTILLTLSDGQLVPVAGDPPSGAVPYGLDEKTLVHVGTEAGLDFLGG